MKTFPIRGALLTALLLILTVGAALSLLADITMWHRMVILFPRWAAIAFTIVAFLRFLTIIWVWFRSKIAIAAYFLLAVINVLVCLSVGITETAIYGVAGAALLAVFLWPKWPQMPWDSPLPRVV